MSKIALAVGSFLLGVCSVLALNLSGIQTSPVPQMPKRPDLPKVPETFPPNPMGKEAEAIGIGDFSPVIPGLADLAPKGEHLTAARQRLDGLRCIGCTFNGVTFEYAGGATNLVNAKFTGPVRIELSGAAANTVAVVAFLQMAARGKKPTMPNPNVPMVKTANVQIDIGTADLVTPFNGATK